MKILLLLFSGLKLGKIALTGGTMLLSMVDSPLSIASLVSAVDC